MLGQQDVGHRVVVRRFVKVRDGRPVYTDLLGELTALSDTELTVLTRTGPVGVPLNLVHRAKRVPAPPGPTPAQIAALEIAADAGWPAPTRGRLGDWLLRAADGFTGRANTALAVGEPGLPLDAAIDAVETWYAERGLRPAFNAPVPLAGALNAALDARGWHTNPITLVQTAPLRAVSVATPEAPADGFRVALAPEPTDGWLAIAAGRKGGLTAAARHVLTAVPQVCFAHVYAEPSPPAAPGGEPTLVAMGRGAVTGAGWLGVSLIEVVPEFRRRGLARVVIGALARWAANAGATRCYLQVEQRNTAAVALYATLGFTPHHSYLTRRAPND